MENFNDLKELGDEATYIQWMPFMATTSIFFALAILAAVFRTLFKLHNGQSFHLDDHILFFGIVCLVTGTAILHIVLPDVYVSMAFSFDPSQATHLSEEQVITFVKKTQTYVDTFHCLLWTSIFAVKFSFMSFFKQFVDRMERMKLYWLAAVMLTGFCWGYMIVTPFIACPYFSEKTVQCSTPSKERLYRALAYVGTVADCVTDGLIVSIPLIILHRVKITFHQKAAIGTFMCLSIGMIIIAIFRAVHIKNPQGTTHDGPLQTFLAYVEGCVAIITVSVTTFRSLYNHHHNQKARLNRLRWFSGSFTRRNEQNTESKEKLNDVTTPGALTGLRTCIRRGSAPKVEVSGGLARKESVLRTREVVVEISYEKDIERDPWISSPSWLKESRISESSDPVNGSLTH